jgi:FHA domain/Zinc-ribbon containing domain
LDHNPGARVFETGRVVGAGSLTCLDCGYTIAVTPLDPIPECGCGGTRFRRASLFEQPTTDNAAVDVEGELGWLDEARSRLADQARTGHFLAFEDDDGVSVLEIGEGWSRIGRSVAAEIRLDDPTVSRRHAVIVRTPEGELKVLDDRSLNGVFVNGDPVDWSPLGNGDELAIGRYRLHVIGITASRADKGSSYALSG